MKKDVYQSPRMLVHDTSMYEFFSDLCSFRDMRFRGDIFWGFCGRQFIKNVFALILIFLKILPIFRKLTLKEKLLKANEKTLSDRKKIERHKSPTRK